MNQSYVQPYLFFAGDCEAALAHYQKHLGAEILMKMTFGESPEAPGESSEGCAGGELPPNWSDKIMHCAFRIGSSVLMGSDGMGEEKPSGGHCMSLTLPDAAEARHAFDALAEGGEVSMPLGETFWSPCFGMVTDAFGISWMVTTPETK